MRSVTRLRPQAIVQVAEGGEPATLGQAARADFSAATGWKVLAVVVVLAWMGFQWGFGNDILLPSIAATAFDAVDDGVSWPGGIGAVGSAALAGLLFWGITQLLDAAIVLSGLRLVPHVMVRLSRFLKGKGWVTPYAEMKWSTRWIIAYASGASLLCLVDVFATGEPGLFKRRRMVATAVALSAGSVGVVVALVTAAAMVGTRIPATASAADVFIRFAKNPLTWIAIFSIVFLAGRVAGKRSDGNSDDSDENGDAQPQEPVDM